MQKIHHKFNLAAVPQQPGVMNTGFAFRNRPFERNPTTWVPSAPMRNGKLFKKTRHSMDNRHFRNLEDNFVLKPDGHKFKPTNREIG